MFLQRNEELKALNSFLDPEGKTAAMVYGIRQIGKSSLILQAVKDRSDVLYFECLDSPIDENLIQLACKTYTQLDLLLIRADDILSFSVGLSFHHHSGRIPISKKKFT